MCFKERNQVRSLELPADDDLAHRINAVDLKDVFGEIGPS
jgi:hypothetical protein